MQCIMPGKETGTWNSGVAMRNTVFTTFKLVDHVTYTLKGPVFRFGPNSLSVNSNTALKTIYGHKANVKKSQFYSVFPPTKSTFNTHSSIDKVAHARKRRVLSQAFSDNAIKGMEKYMLGNIRTFCTLLGSKPALSTAEKAGEKGQWSTAQNMADWCNYLTFDVMGDLCFGKAFEMLENHSNRRVIDLLGNAAHMHLIVSSKLSTSLAKKLIEIARHKSYDENLWPQQTTLWQNLCPKDGIYGVQQSAGRRTHKNRFGHGPKGFLLLSAQC